jgi:hypothetical protein
MFEGQNLDTITRLYSQNGIDDILLNAAINVKNESSQIHEVVHAIGILLLLPKILEQGEKIQTLSLGAGNTGKDFDLETNKRVAEFKFIHWKGGPESIRKNSLFKDFFYLAENNKKKKRCLYVIGLKYPLEFLRGGRDLSSVLKDKRLADDYRRKYGNKYKKVCEYYAHRKDRVILTDMKPLLRPLAQITE